MAYNKKDFPVNKKPIYDYSLTDDGCLVCKEHFRYETLEPSPGYHLPGHVSYLYRIHTGNGIISKNEHQMERYLNGHLFTLQKDSDRALDIIIKHYSEKETEAQAMADKCSAMLLRIRTANPGASHV